MFIVLFIFITISKSILSLLTTTSKDISKVSLIQSQSLTIIISFDAKNIFSTCEDNYCKNKACKALRGTKTSNFPAQNNFLQNFVAAFYTQKLSGKHLFSRKTVPKRILLFKV